MQLDERLDRETDELRVEADAELTTLLGSVTSSDYRQFLERTLGFVAPFERSLWATAGLERVVDMRRFQKRTLLRHDLLGFGLKHDEIGALSRCSIPQFESPEVALGWAYVVERSTLPHVDVFRHLASVMPGDVAYTASYLRAHFGAARANWREFVDAINAIAATTDRADTLVAAAKAAFQARREWRDRYEEIAIGGRRVRVA
ncbi:MAG TPA: biliverdin-producing heme oxygenase [Kofleriaceae bacterium]